MHGQTDRQTDKVNLDTLPPKEVGPKYFEQLISKNAKNFQVFVQTSNGFKTQPGAPISMII